MIRRLAEWDNYPSRISSCLLIGQIFQSQNEGVQGEMLDLFEEFCKDDSPMVRRVASENIRIICNYVTKQRAKEILQPLWVVLVNDQIDSIRVKTIESMIALLKCLEDPALLISEFVKILRRKQNS